MFHSKLEGKQYFDLKVQQGLGLIRDLRLQVAFPILINGIKICVYYADFVYFDLAEGCEIVRDAKGFRTKEYRLKKKMVEAYYSIKILET